MKFMPLSIALFNAASDVASSTSPQVPPIAQAPKETSETFQPVRPSGRYFIFNSERCLSPFAGDDFVIFALADAAQRIILAHRIAAVAVPGEDAAKIGMIGENDAEHVVYFALHPFGAGPDAADAGDFQTGIALLDGLLVADIVAWRCVVLRIEKHLQPPEIVF